MYIRNSMNSISIYAGFYIVCGFGGLRMPPAHPLEEGKQDTSQACGLCDAQRRAALKPKLKLCDLTATLKP